MKNLKIVVPCYNEKECVRALFYKIDEVFSNLVEKYCVSILYVDDGSKDGTLFEIKRLQEEVGKDKVSYISFARNFGKEAAIYAGFSNLGNADIVALMDADLQHPPELLPQMLSEIENGLYDCCGARRISRNGEPVIRSFFSNLFYKFINKVTAMELVQGGSDYRVMKRNVAEAIITLRETERFSKGIFSWVGFETKWIEYENVERYAGKTKWSWGGLMRYAISGFMAFATTPLRGAVYLGIITVFASIIYMIYTFIGACFFPGARTGYATIVILLLFLSGVIISLLGVVGEYLARIYMEVKHRPIYIAKDKCIWKEERDEKTEI